MWILVETEVHIKLEPIKILNIQQISENLYDKLFKILKDDFKFTWYDNYSRSDIVILDKIVNLRILSNQEIQTLKNFITFDNNLYSSGCNIFEEYEIQSLCEIISDKILQLSIINNLYEAFCDYFEDFIVWIYKSKRNYRIKYLEDTKLLIDEYLNSTMIRQYSSKTIIPPILKMIQSYIFETKYFYIKIPKEAKELNDKKEILRHGDYLCIFTFFYGIYIPLEILMKATNPIFNDIIEYMKNYNLKNVYFLRQNFN